MNVPRAAYSFRMSFWIVPPSFDGAAPRSSATISYIRSNRPAGALIVIEVVTAPGRSPRTGGAYRRALRSGRRPSHFAKGAWVIGVETQLRRQIKGDAQPCRSTLQQQPVTGVALLDRGEAGVLAHGPASPAIHRGINAAGERERSGIWRRRRSRPRLPYRRARSRCLNR